MITFTRMLLVLGLCAGMAQGAIRIDLRDSKALMKITDDREIRSAVFEMSNISDVRKIMLVDDLRGMLADNTLLRLDGYVLATGEPDLRVVAGRAEWLIDQIMLMPREAGRKSTERIDMWKASVASRHTLLPEQIEGLRRKYAGKVIAGENLGGRAFDSIENFDKFLEEWFPYGKSVQAMEQTLGIKLRIEGGGAVLHIDSGIGGIEYQFMHEEGIIRVVKRVGTY